VVRVSALVAAACAIASGCLGSGSGLAPCSDGGSGGPLSGALTDGRVAAIMLEAHRDVIHLAKVALLRSGAAAIQSFATKLVADHSAAIARLQSLMANIQGLESAERQDLEDKAADAVNNLWATAASDFDSAFAQAQVNVHQTVQQLLEDLTPGVLDAGLKAELQSELTTEVEHLGEAQQLAATFSAATTGLLSSLGSLKLDDGQIAAVVMEAHNGVIHAAEVALSRSSSASVRSLAMQLIQDHSGANTQLQSILQSANIGAEDSAARQAIADQSSQALNALWATAASDFDSAFAQRIVSMHQTLQQLLEQLIPGTQASALKAELESELTAVMNDLAKAQQLAATFPTAATDGGATPVDAGPTTGTDGGTH
jgi:putative membrane protein